MSTLALKKCRSKPTYVSVRSFRNYDKDAFRKDISNDVPWSITENLKDVNESLNAFDSLFNEILDQRAPIKKVKVRVRPNPFVTEEIRVLMHCRDRWRKLSRKSGNSIAWSTYRNCKCEVKRLLRLAQKSYVEQEIKKDPNNSSNMWKIIPTYIPKISNGNTCFENLWRITLVNSSHQLVQIQLRKSNHLLEKTTTIHQSLSQAVILSLNSFPLNLWSPPWLNM